MIKVGQNLSIPLFVFGPETHMTAIVGMALGKRDIPTEVPAKDGTTANFLLPGSVGSASGSNQPLLVGNLVLPIYVCMLGEGFGDMKI